MAGLRIKLGTPAILVGNFTTELPRPIFMIHIAPTTKHTYMHYHISLVSVPGYEIWLITQFSHHERV